ncbi:MAG TPA: serine hydrolase domain-containing protein [Planctomycetota bacterium]|nr:serine hydrolase domain-containing protein [Planctomycetota bacterium]
MGTALALCLIVTSSWAGNPLEGPWAVRIERTGWQPEIATGTLLLKEKGGSLAFDVVLYARRYDLADVELRGKQVSFRLQSGEFDLRFAAELKGTRLEGRCDWKGCGDFPFTAQRKDARPQERFENGLSFAGFFPKGDPKYGGATMDEMVAGAAESDTDALLVLKDGKVVCERTFGRPARPIHVMSVTKFMTAIAVGLLLEEKKIPSVDAPISAWFPEWADKGVALRHLLTHTSGIEVHQENGHPSARLLNAEKDKVAYVRALKLATPPGTQYLYNNEAVALLSGVIAAAAGEEADDYLARRLMKPLGIRDWKWDRDEAGHPLTYANLQLTARDLARIGQMVAEGGKGVVAPETIRLLGSPATPIAKGQGLLWMLRLDAADKVVGYFHTGWLGQYLYVYPERKLVGVRLRSFKNEQEAEKPEYQFGRFPALLESLP